MSEPWVTWDQFILIANMRSGRFDIDEVREAFKDAGVEIVGAPEEGDVA